MAQSERQVEDARWKPEYGRWKVEVMKRKSVVAKEVQDCPRPARKVPVVLGHRSARLQDRRAPGPRNACAKLGDERFQDAARKNICEKKNVKDRSHIIEH